MPSDRRDGHTSENVDEPRSRHGEQAAIGLRIARLAEIRTRRDLSQSRLAGRMGVSQARVSAIEQGELTTSEIRTISKYVTALGGRLEIVVNLGNERLLLY